MMAVNAHNHTHTHTRTHTHTHTHIHTHTYTHTHTHTHIPTIALKFIYKDSVYTHSFTFIECVYI